MTSVQTTTAVYSVKEGDSLSEIGETLGIDWRKIAELNHINDPFVIHPHQKLKLPGRDFKSLPIKDGDTLSGMSARLSKNVSAADKPKLSVTALQRLNRIADPDLIFAGDMLVYRNLDGTP